MMNPSKLRSLYTVKGGLTMPIARLIYVTVKPEQGKQAEELWKQHCAPLMISQPGCLSEELLKCLDAPGEYISYSEWDSDENIERYSQSDAHQEIKRHAGELDQLGPAIVKCYRVVP